MRDYWILLFRLVLLMHDSRVIAKSVPIQLPTTSTVNDLKFVSRYDHLVNYKMERTHMKTWRRLLRSYRPCNLCYSTVWIIDSCGVGSFKDLSKFGYFKIDEGRNRETCQTTTCCAAKIQDCCTNKTKGTSFENSRDVRHRHTTRYFVLGCFAGGLALGVAVVLLLRLFRHRRNVKSTTESRTTNRSDISNDAIETDSTSTSCETIDQESCGSHFDEWHRSALQLIP
jgi:hypothetical protein